VRGGRVGAAIAIVVVLGAGAWFFTRRRSGASSLSAEPAHLAAEWRGTYRGRMTFPAHINWCPVTRVGMLEGISGDSGMAIVFYERESLAGVPHQVTSPDLAAGTPRPAATVAIRWVRMATDTQLALFRSLSGTVRLQVMGGHASGNVTARMRGMTGSDSLVITGEFRDVPIVTTAVGCT
jgi:hypothetical protein